ncbi:bile acid:sodium symporter family protein [Vibrio furnissii]|uniref:bile acid:sodium symporter family protein n=1 Tax=Vibrio furnissii TaxID=29494 RepID=UPI001EEA29B7|nr:bile acid:sodium symporter [Vibrio furnissii]
MTGVVVFEKIKKEWFLLGMLSAIALSFLSPEVGRSGGWLQLDKFTQLGIAVIFFLHGIHLSPAKLKQGISNWPLHLLIQLTTFVVYPLIWVVSANGLNAIFPSALALGFCYLFALPGTVSSSVAMTSLAKGNVPGAIFNASLSSVIGVALTPLLLELLTGEASESMPLIETILSITKIILVPMIIGQLSRPLLSSILNNYRNVINRIDKLVIIFIVFNAFSDAVVEDVWKSFSLSTLSLCIIVCLVVIFFITHFIRRTAQYFNMHRDDEIAALFCGTKKTLSAGIPMAKVIFSANPNLGMILLPIMLYHPIQLFYCSVIARKYEKT